MHRVLFVAAMWVNEASLVLPYLQTPESTTGEGNS
jgi:hypothetical protein